MTSFGLHRLKDKQQQVLFTASNQAMEYQATVLVHKQ